MKKLSLCARPPTNQNNGPNQFLKVNLCLCWCFWNKCYYETCYWRYHEVHYFYYNAYELLFIIWRFYKISYFLWKRVIIHLRTVKPAYQSFEINEIAPIWSEHNIADGVNQVKENSALLGTLHPKTAVTRWSNIGKLKEKIQRLTQLEKKVRVLKLDV